jgi:hypothetical protein
MDPIPPAEISRGGIVSNCRKVLKNMTETTTVEDGEGNDNKQLRRVPAVVIYEVDGEVLEPLTELCQSSQAQLVHTMMTFQSSMVSVLNSGLL